MMNWGKRLVALLPLMATLTACSGDKSEEQHGNLSLALTGVDRAGVTYRLRSATFNISGYSYLDPGMGVGMATGGSVSNGYYSETVSTEEDINAPFITRRLLTGQYTTTLENDTWYLERLTAEGAERVEQAVLLSPRTQYAYIYSQSRSDVTYNFGIDGELIDFRGGDLNIGISVERPGEQNGTGGSITSGGSFPTSGGAFIGGASSTGGTSAF